MQYPWKRIYTTNYDDVLEHVNGPDGARPDSFSRETLPLVFEGSNRQIVHLNGYVGAITIKSVVDDFALTLSSYFDKSLFGSRWAGTLRTDFELASAIVFAGYSMVDTDISNLVGADPRLIEKSILIQRKDLSISEEKFLARFGRVEKIGMDGLAKVVADVLSSGQPTVLIGGAENFLEISLPDSPIAKSVTDLAIENLLIRGVFDRELYFAGIVSSSRPYLFPRTDAAAISETLTNAGKSVLLHGELGSGKTFLLEQIMFNLLRSGRRVFLLDRRTERFDFDVEFFKGLDGNFVLIIEDVLSNGDLVETLQSQLSRLRVLGTIRTSTFEVKAHEVRELMPEGTLEWDANKLRNEDLEGICKLLDSGVYWPQEVRNRSLEAKKKFLRTECRMELSSVLVGVVKSAILNSELKSTFAFSDQEIRRAIQVAALALCLNLIEIRPTFSLLSELLARDVYSVSNSAKLERFRSFVPVSGIEVLARSPIMSEYILKTIVPDDFLIELLTGALEVSSKLYKKASRYRLINSKFMQYSFISRVVASKNNSHERIAGYYDQLGELGYKSFSPHFWLQYAIACRAARRFPTAERYFTEARRIAESQHDFDTYQIDNAFAIFLLESRMESDNWSDYFDAFQLSSNYSLKQTYLKKTGTYPYRVASRFLDYLEMRGSKFTTSQKSQTKEVLKGWLARFSELPTKFRTLHVVSRSVERVALAHDYFD